MDDPKPSETFVDERTAEEIEQAVFDEALVKSHPRLVAVPLLVIANVAVYVAIAVSGGDWVVVDWRTLIEWGSNLGPHTANDEPWRLASSMFLHANIAHLLVNMLTLYDAGRQYERMVGAWRFLLLYVIAGLAGGAMSVTSNPWVNSVGASGAICGILGALLVLMLSDRDDVPWSVLKGRAVSVGIFVVYSIIEATRGSAIDHAAHFGGFSAGVALGLFFVPAMHGETRSWISEASRIASAIAVCALGVAMALSNKPDLREGWAAERRFLEDLEWYQSVEQPMLDEAQRLTRLIDKPESKREAEKVAVQAADIHRHLDAYRLHERSDRRRLHELLIEFTDLHRQACALLAETAGPDGRAKLSKSDYSTVLSKANDVSWKIHFHLRR